MNGSQLQQTRLGQASVVDVGRPRLLQALYGVLILLSLVLSLKVVVGVVGVDPDSANTLALWLGVKQHGLGWLADWSFTQDNWLFSLLPVNALLFELLGPRAEIPIYVGWVVFAAPAARTAGR